MNDALSILRRILLLYDELAFLLSGPKQRKAHVIRVFADHAFRYMRKTFRGFHATSGVNPHMTYTAYQSSLAGDDMSLGVLASHCDKTR